MRVEEVNNPALLLGREEPLAAMVAVIGGISTQVSLDTVAQGRIVFSLDLGKDGLETDQTLTLNEWNHWKGSFTDLLKYDENDGHAIQYAIKEVPVPNYSAWIQQSDTGYMITNTNIETRSIPVHKKWIGPKVNSIVLSLYADGKDTGKEMWGYMKDSLW